MADDRKHVASANRGDHSPVGTEAGSLLMAVLAAGASRRLGQAKQLVRVDGESLLRRQCRVALEAGVGRVAAVLGCRAEECAAIVNDLPVEQLINEHWQQGLGGSIAVAARAASAAGAAGLLLMHVDQFRVSAADLNLLHQAWQDSGCECVCIAMDGEYVGPPVIIPNAMFGDLERLDGDIGAQRLIASLPPTRVRQVQIPTAAHDLDLPSDLSAIAAGRSR
jgi:molybdenum cofactor cytidylyltransferase